MFTKTRSSPVKPSASEAIANTIGEPPSEQSLLPLPNTPHAPEAVGAPGGAETRAEHFRRKALRGRLYGYAIAIVALVAVLIALAASNTAHVKVNWLVGSSRVSLVWLVLAAALLGWALGSMLSARLHWRTRAPRAPHRTGS